MPPGLVLAVVQHRQATSPPTPPPKADPDDEPRMPLHTPTSGRSLGRLLSQIVVVARLLKCGVTNLVITEP